MPKLGIWSITDQGPRRVIESEVDLESHLEAWIEKDPALLRAGLTIVARQMVIEGGRLDLLALDPQARWIIIEVKRGLLSRDTVAQAIDYASYLATMPQEALELKIDAYLSPRGSSLKTLLGERDAAEATRPDARELQIIIVGTGIAPELARMVSFLADRHSFPITLVSCDVFEISPNHRVLAREITAPDVRELPGHTPQGPSLADLVKTAEASGIGPHFRAIFAIADNAEVSPRPCKRSIMSTPTSRRDRMLFTVNASPSGGKLKVYVSPSAVAEFYPVTAERAEAALGVEGWHVLDERGARQFAEGFLSLVSQKAAP